MVAPPRPRPSTNLGAQRVSQVDRGGSLKEGVEIAYRPTYRQAIAPEEAACMMAPAPAKKAAMRRAGLRPSLSEIGFAIRLLRRHRLA